MPAPPPAIHGFAFCAAAAAHGVVWLAGFDADGGAEGNALAKAAAEGGFVAEALFPAVAPGEEAALVPAAGAGGADVVVAPPLTKNRVLFVTMP